MLYLSPTEHDLANLARSTGVQFANSSLCEENGVDCIVTSSVGLIGFQRKRLADLEASLADGRLAKELGQIRASRILRHAALVFESDPRRATTDGRWLDSRLSYSQVRTVGLKCQLSGVHFLETWSLADTLETVQKTADYIASNRANDLYRPKPQADTWGRRTSRDWALHLLQSFANIGPRTAADIYDTLGLPLSWTCTRDQLLAIPGVGPKTADALLAALRVLPNQAS
jgi:ERCC4-type nuclease